MFPSVECGGVELPPGCCEGIWKQGEALLNAIAGPVLNCALPPPCNSAQLRAFISLGRPETWESDFVAVWLQGVSFSNGSLTASGNNIFMPVLRCEWNTLIIESNYPGLVPLDNGSVAVPSDDDFHAANRHAYAHGQAMLQGILDFGQSNCGGFVLRAFQPVTPENFSAGWAAAIAVEMPTD